MSMTRQLRPLAAALKAPACWPIHDRDIAAAHAAYRTECAAAGEDWQERGYTENPDAVRACIQWLAAQRPADGEDAEERSAYSVKHRIGSWASLYATEADCIVAARLLGVPGAQGLGRMLQLPTALVLPDARRLSGIAAAGRYPQDEGKRERLAYRYAEALIALPSEWGSEAFVYRLRRDPIRAHMSA